MLDEKDLQILQSLFEQSEARMTARIDESIAASEARMTARIDESIAASEARMTARIDESIAASEARMTARIDGSIAASEARMTDRIAASESRIMAYIESDILPRFDKLADGHDLLRETLAPISRVERLEEEVSTLRSAVRLLAADVSELKKAQ